MALNTCSDCGSNVSSEATTCPNCGKPLNSSSEKSNPESGDYGNPPKTWLLESILATIFCCIPLGIVGIIYATRVESNWFAGRKEIALNASKNAKTWTLITFFTGLSIIILYLLFAVVIGIGAASMNF